MNSQLNLSKKCNNSTSAQKASCPNENISTPIYSSKKIHETNKKKVPILKNRTKPNNNLNNSSSGNNCNNKTQLHSKKTNVDNNNIKSFKNQNVNSQKYCQKPFTKNIKTNSTSEQTISNVSLTMPVTPVAISNKNNFCYTTFNQGTMENGVLYQPHLANQPILNYQNQCYQQFHFENWNANSTNQQNGPNINRDCNEVSHNKNLSPYFVNHLTANIPKICTNNKQYNIIKNNFVAHSKNSNCYNSNSDLNCSSSASTTNQHNNRIKTHQNYHNLTYVVTDKENVISSTTSINKNVDTNFKINNKNSTNNKESNITITDNKTHPLSTISPNNNDNVENLEPLIEENAALSKNSTSQNGYDSDSSHCSSAINSIHYEPQYPVLTHLLPNYTLTSSLESDVYKTNINHYAVLQHNFTYFNSNPNCHTYNNICSPNKTYYQTEPPTIYLNDNSTLFQTNKKIQKRHLHGRRHWIPTLKSSHVPENTPPDKFLTKSHLMEIKQSPNNLKNGSKWDELSSDIWSKFSTYQQKEITYRKKIFLWKYLYLSIKRNFPRYGLYLVGSTITGFGTNCSDVDMCLVHRASFSLDSRFEAISHLNNINEYLKTLGIFEKFHLIEAKVPILRFCDTNNSLEVDLNFNNSVGIRNTHLLYCYSQLDWRLRPLTLTIKLWARYHNINNAKTMTISSYSLALMVIHFLQCGVNPPVLPCLHEMYPEKFNIILMSSEFGFVDMMEEIEPYESKNSSSLGELFFLFLEYYSNFNYAKYAISVRTGKMLPIEECRNAQSQKNDIHQWKQLCIEEPFDLTNTARSVYDCETFDKIKNIFLMSWKILQSTLHLNRIFSSLYYYDESETQNSL